MSTQLAEKTGLFVAKYNIGMGAPGAPSFHIELTVNAVNKDVNGEGRITQAVNPPLDIHTRLHGDFTYMTVMPDNTSILVVLTGYPAVHWPRGGGIGPVLRPDVHLRMVLSQDWKTGTASYSYLGADGEWHEANDVPVKLD